MSHSDHSHQGEHSSSAGHLNYASPGMNPNPSGLLLVGGPLGIAASFIGLAIFLASCFGFAGALMFSILPLILSIVGLVLSFAGVLVRRGTMEDTQVLAALLINFVAIVGALLEFSAYNNWQIFQR